MSCDAHATASGLSSSGSKVVEGVGFRVLVRVDANRRAVEMAGRGPLRSGDIVGGRRSSSRGSDQGWIIPMELSWATKPVGSSSQLVSRYLYRNDNPFAQRSGKRTGESE